MNDEQRKIVEGLILLIKKESGACTCLAADGKGVDEFRKHYELMGDALGIARRLDYFPDETLQILRQREEFADELAKKYVAVAGA